MKTMPPKDPNSKVDYTIDWSLWLVQGDAISTSTWIVPTGLTDEGSSFDSSSARIWLSGGVAAAVYIVTNRITTSGGRIQDASFKVRVQSL